MIWPLAVFSLVVALFVSYSFWMPIYHLKKFAYEGDKCKSALYLYALVSLIIVATTITAIFFVRLFYA